MADKKVKTVDDVINESVNFAQRLKSSAEKSVLETFSNLVAEDVKLSLSESLEPFPTKPDYPGDYDQDGGQKRIDGAGDSLEDKGDGPDIIEGDEPDESGATMSTEKDPVTAKNAHDSIAEMDDLNLDLPGDDEMGGDEKDMNMESDLSVENKDEEDKDEKKDDKVVKENASLKKVIAQLKVENAKLKKGINLITRKLEETALINTKMASMNRIFTSYPSLSIGNKKKIAESIDKAKDINQIKVIVETVNAVMKNQKSKKSDLDGSTTRAKQIVEAAKKNKQEIITEGTKENFNRFQQLAGIDQ